ncbi:hypothetical protein [Hymenobacter arizonensis]|uniref:Uncharacterized protein n=1 Tax=Hymenobacter arizonensis TaxID=1227077 RepID=A0A1I6BMQ2_HYMAR|nr:hypothetical protein [Hymenobacter arizonensis]SFQ82212.1 hypothetical protein SAMN04515668_4762 [Hymenobacter arizonensis]
MVLHIQPHELAPLYLQAREGYDACINHPENGHLHAQAPVPLSEISVRHGEVKAVFSPATPGTYQLEVQLWLYVQEAYFGQYVYLMNAAEEVLEDKLVFY